MKSKLLHVWQYWCSLYILLFNLKEWLMLLLQDVREVKQSTPAFTAASLVRDSIRQNGLVTIYLSAVKSLFHLKTIIVLYSVYHSNKGFDLTELHDLNTGLVHYSDLHWTVYYKLESSIQFSGHGCDLRMYIFSLFQLWPKFKP